MSNKMNFQTLLEQAANDYHDVSIREYSGRAMYGRQCLAITGKFDVCHRVIADAIKAGLHEVFGACDVEQDQDPDAGYLTDDAHSRYQELQAIIDQSAGMCQDSMGLGVVLYWPNIEYVDTESDEDDGDDE